MNNVEKTDSKSELIIGYPKPSRHKTVKAANARARKLRREGYRVKVTPFLRHMGAMAWAKGYRYRTVVRCKRGNRPAKQGHRTRREDGQAEQAAVLRRMAVERKREEATVGGWDTRGR